MYIKVGSLDSVANRFSFQTGTTSHCQWEEFSKEGGELILIFFPPKRSSWERRGEVVVNGVGEKGRASV